MSSITFDIGYMTVPDFILDEQGSSEFSGIITFGKQTAARIKQFVASHLMRSSKNGPFKEVPIDCLHTIASYLNGKEWSSLSQSCHS